MTIGAVAAFAGLCGCARLAVASPAVPQSRDFPGCTECGTQCCRELALAAADRGEYENLSRPGVAGRARLVHATIAGP